MKGLFDRIPTWLWMIALFAIALVPRLFALGRYVTPDEPNWVYRTLNFGAALARGDWAGSVQSGHPGATTMWLGTLGIALERAFNPVGAADALNWLSRLDRLSPENVEAFRHIGVLLDWARLPVFVINALGVAGVFLMARRLFGPGVALLAAFLLALDPFVAGLGGLLHVDGLLTTFSTLSVLALLNGLSGIADSRWQMADGDSPSAISRHRSAVAWFALSGALAGLALLSKSPALFLVPFTLIVVMLAVVIRRISLRSALFGLLAFFILLSAFFIALYPAMWSDPSVALDLILERASHHATDATRPTFFDGQAELNHGAGFYLPALAYRVSPVAFIGLCIAIFALVRGRRPDAHISTPGGGSRFAAAVLLLFAVLFLAFLTPAAKKFDRYLLPIVPPLIFVAAWGFSQLTSRRASKRLPDTDLVTDARISFSQLTNQRASNRFRFIAPAAIALQAILLLSVAPYPLMAYNPLLGGAAGARSWIAVGWGEGFGAAAAWIAENDPGAAIATGGLSNTAPLYEGKVVTIDDAGLASADYIVYTVSESQLLPQFFQSLAQKGTFTRAIRMGGIETAWVYRTIDPVRQAQWIGPRLQPDDAILLDAATPLAGLLPPHLVTVLPPGATPESISAMLGALRGRHRIVHVTTDAASPVVQREVRDWLAAHARLVDDASAAGAGIRVYEPNRDPARPLDSFTVQFDGALALIGLEPLPASAAYPDLIAVAARWLTLGKPATSYTATIELTDVYGDTWTRFGGPLRNSADLAPVHWQPGEVAEQVFSFRVPPELAPGDYRLRLSVERPDGNRVGLVSASGAFSGTAPSLADVRIDPARPSFEPDLLDPRARVHYTWPDRVELLGIDLLTYVVATGDQFLATMHWRSLRDGLDPSTELRWSLAPETAAGEASAFEWRTPLAPNTDVALFDGDIISARYSARLPHDLPEGRYRLRLTIGDEALEAAPIDLWHRERDFDLPVGAVEVGSVGPFDVFLSEPLPDQVRAGDPVEVKLALRTNEEVNVNYTLFIHLVDAENRIVAQVDTWPQGGLWPTANLVRAQVVEDVLKLTWPPEAGPGAYRLAIGMYDALDGTRLPVRNSGAQSVVDGRLILDTLIEIASP
jgi:4-amino-4-deoxy-L-arabinose transferase-like glycosyltransferase